MNDIETIKTRVKKLLALSKSSNENEAAVAMKLANEIIEKYELNQTEFDSYTNKTVKDCKKYVEWRAILANAVEQLYATYHIRDVNTGEFIFYGEELDVFMSTEMFIYLKKTIDRMVKKNVRKNAKYKYRQSYRTGIADRLWFRMNELGQQCSWRNPKERENKKAEISKWVHNKHELLHKSSTKFRKLNTAAFQKGSLDADGINLSRQMSGNITKRIEN